jgi:integrase
VGKRETNVLTPVAVKNKNKSGYYGDGNGLYLQVTASGAKSWIFRFKLNKRQREMGLGSIGERTLAEARIKVKEYRDLLDKGIDPIDHRQQERQQNAQARAQRRTFEECAREYHKLHASGWKNAKHADQWINTLTTYSIPAFGNKDVSSITKADIITVLEPIWLSKAETASRVRQRIRAVLDWAAARDYRVGHDPHMWDQIAKALPKTKDVKKETHFAACPYAEINATIKAIRESTASHKVKLAAEFIVLNASRSGEVRFAKWAEIDFNGERWIIPKERMKSGREHRVPLSWRSKEILAELWRDADKDGFIFANDKGNPYSDMTFTQLLRRLGFSFTVHGFRSSFRDWCAEQTAYPREICEAALAHSNKDEVEAAYFRSDLFEKRRQLMEAWATYCATERQDAKVIKIGEVRKSD